MADSRPKSDWPVTTTYIFAANIAKCYIKWTEKNVFWIISFILTLLLFHCNEDQVEKPPSSQFYHWRFPVLLLCLYTGIGAAVVELLLRKRDVINKVHNVSDKHMNSLVFFKCLKICWRRTNFIALKSKMLLVTSYVHVVTSIKYT